MRKILFSFLGCFFLIIAHAQSAESQLSQLLGSIQKLSASFTQQTFSEKGKVLQSTSGKMYLSRPGNFRWEIQEPSKQILVVSHNKVWFYDVDLAQVTVRHFDNNNQQTPALLLSEANQTILNTFTITSTDGKQFLLIPKKTGNAYSQLRLTFDKNQLTTMSLQDSLGQRTDLHFTNIVTDPALSPNLFVFKTPPHVDVLQE